MESSFKAPKSIIFNHNANENFEKFLKSFEIYMKATGYDKKEDETKVAIFLNVAGEEAQDIFQTLKMSEEDQKNYQKVIDEFKKYCKPLRNETFDRYKFFKRNQGDGEEFDHYLTDLKILAKNCNFGELEDSLIRDKIVSGVRDVAVQERLLRIADLTLAEAERQVRATEASKFQMKNLQNVQVIDAVRKKNRNVTRSEVKKKTYLCKKCQTVHEERNCPAYGKACTVCNKMGHYAVGCRYRQGRANRRPSRPNERPRVQEIVETEQETETEGLESLFRINTLEETKAEVSAIKKQWTEDIIINNRYTIKFKLDTGSEVNVIPLNVYKTFDISCNTVSSVNNNVKLEAYGGFMIQPLAKMKLKCTVGNVSADLEFVIVDNNAMPILGLIGCMQLNLIYKNDYNIVNEINIYNKTQFIANNKMVFEGVGCFPDTYRIKIDKNVEGIIKPPRRLPQTMMNKLKTELDTLTKNKIIDKVNEPKEWASNLVIIQKNDGNIRICLDPNELNKAIKRDYHLIPKFENVRDKLLNKKFYTVLDIKQGFWHIKLDAESSDLCCFSTPFGYYRFNRLPFGLSCAPEAFIKLNEKYFGNIDPENIIIYFDDILIATKTEQKHDMLLNAIIEKAKQYNIKFNINKVQYKQKEIKFLGHVFNENGVKPDEDQVKAIMQLAEPKNKKELQRILGMINYLREFIPNMADLTSSFRQLLKNNVVFYWSKIHTEALNKLKAVIANLPLLNHFDPEKEIIIQSDASKDGLGCSLLQGNKPISFASRSMTNTECSYAQIEKELLSLVFACRKFHYYIYGRKIIAYTDHAPLITIMKKDISQIPNNRLQKMRLKLFNYDIELRYLPGKKMFLADLLSRNYLPEKYNEEINMEGVVHCINRYDNNYSQLYNVKNATINDPILSKVVEYCTIGWPNKNKLDVSLRHYYNMKNELLVENGILYFDNRIVIPTELRKTMLNLLHESHQGITKTRLRAKNILYWPGMMNEIETCVSKCKICEKFRANNKKEPLIPHEVPYLPFEKVASDILTYNNVDYIVLIDYYSKWIEVSELRYKTASEVINKLKNIFAVHGIPQTFISDNMPFLSHEFQNFARTWNFKSVTTSPRYPRSNGEAEKAVHIVKQMIKKKIEEGKDLSISLLEYRSTIIPGMDASPSELLMSRLLRTKLPIANVKLEPKLQSDVRNRLLCRQEKYKEYHDRRVVERNSFKVGENIVVRKDKVWSPAVIIEKCNTPRSYLIKDQNCELLRRNSSHLRKSLNVPEFNSANVDLQEDIVKCEPNDSTNVKPEFSPKSLPKRNTRLPVRFKDYVLT